VDQASGHLTVEEEEDNHETTQERLYFTLLNQIITATTPIVCLGN
jgi:hypothetical protein